MSGQGYIKLYRQFWSWRYSPVTEARAFTRSEAWLWLLCHAAHRDHVRENIFIERGCLLTSQRELASAWRWHRSSVMRFLNELTEGATLNGVEYEPEVRMEVIANHKTIIGILNYERYQGSSTNTKQSNVPALNHFLPAAMLAQELNLEPPASHQRATSEPPEVAHEPLFEPPISAAQTAYSKQSERPSFEPPLMERMEKNVKNYYDVEVAATKNIDGQSAAPGAYFEQPLIPREVMNALRDFFGADWVTPGLLGMVSRELVNGASVEHVVEAIEATAAQGKRSWPYTLGIIRRLERDEKKRSYYSAPPPPEPEEEGERWTLTDEQARERQELLRMLWSNRIDLATFKQKMNELRERQRKESACES